MQVVTQSGRAAEIWVRATSTYAWRGGGVGQMRMVRVRGGGGVGRCVRGGVVRGGRGRGLGSAGWSARASARRAWPKKRTEMTEKRAKIGRVSVENQPVFGNNTHLGALPAVVTRHIRSGTLH